MKLGNRPLRIQIVPNRKARCRLCLQITECCAVDHDLRGHICVADYGFVVIAEKALIKAGLEIPTDSLFDI